MREHSRMVATHRWPCLQEQDQVLELGLLAAGLQELREEGAAALFIVDIGDVHLEVEIHA